MKRTFGVFRFVAFDDSTHAGRSDERHHRIAWTGLTGGVAKGISLLVMLISVPLTLNYLGPERFGMWMTISAVTTMLSFADFGLSNGMLTAVAHASGKGARSEIQRIVSSGFVTLALVGAVLLALFFSIYSHVSWAEVFNVASATAVDETGRVLSVLLCCLVASLLFGATQKIQLGLQRGYWANVWEALGSIASLVAIVFVIDRGMGLEWIALAATGTPIVFRLFNTLVFFGRQKPDFRPRLEAARVQTMVRLGRVGILFFILQIAILVGFQSDNIIIARILGADAVAGYDVVMKLATLPAMVVGLVLVGQWPAYGEALTRGDTEWIKTTFYRTLRLNFIAAVPFAVVLVVWGASIVELWAGGEVIPSPLLLVGMALWSVILTVGSVTAALLNGLNVVKFQAVNALLMATGNILLSIVLVHRIGVAGAIYGTVCAYTVFTLLPCVYFVPRHLKRLSGEDPIS